MVLSLFAALASAAVSTAVRMNSVGFLPNNVKRASIYNAGAGNFNVQRASDNSIAYSGTLSAAATNADTGESLRIADFSALTESGSFYLNVAGVGQGPTFQIGADVYNEPLWATIMGFYSHRCGMAVSYTFKGQTFGHDACHLGDGYLDYVGGGHTLRDGTMGWHDAGDYGKYTINLAFAAGQLLQAWEWHKAVLSQWTLPIPEDGNGTPDYLNEVHYGLAWLLKMQAADGSAYHKLTATNFAGFISPSSDTSQRFFTPASSQATADLCAVMSMGARIFQPYNAAFAAQCRTVADKAWTWLQANPGEMLANLAGFGTGAYNEAGTDADHRVWAAAEYWQTTGNAAALSDFESRMAADPDKVSVYWDWGEHLYGKRGPKNHGIFTYLLSARAGRDPVRVADLQADLLSKADGIVATRNAHGYGRPLGTQYHWGSNGTVARQVMLLDAANQISPNANYVNTGLDALGFLFGRNMYDRSFLTGIGYNPPMNPHDRMSASDGITNPVPGHLVGGAESTADSWTDSQGDFTTNEIALNWDAPMVAALSWYCTVPPPATPTPTPSPTPCFNSTALRRVNLGGPTVSTGGNTWTADQAYSGGGWGYTGGAVSTNGNAIAGTTDDVLYNTGRYGMSQYQFTVPNGSYRVELHMAETYFSAAGARVFSVALEGQPAISALDIYASVGGSAALVLTRSTTVSDGVLTLDFSASADSAEVRAIAIYAAGACPSTPTFTPSPNWSATPTATRSPSFSPSPTRTPSPSITPTPSLSPTPCGDQLVARLNCGGPAFTDGAGALWAADNDYSGGTAASVANAIAGTTDDALYQSERYASPLDYAIPVPAAGSYQVRFLWAETYHTAAGQRVFSVQLEGATSISNLDLFAAAGGGDRAYELTRTVTVNDGTLNIAATASVDQAKFDAIEVLWKAPACNSPTPSPTLAPPSQTPTRTATPSPTRSGSPTASTTATASQTASATPTPTATPSFTRTAMGSPSSTGTASPTRTSSASPSVTATPSDTATLSSTPTRSPAPSVSMTGSPTLTPAVGSPTATATWTPTSIATLTASPSASTPATLSVTATPLPPSSTPTASGTVTGTRSPSASPSPTMSPSGTGSMTPSQTASPSQTLSPTAVPTGSSATPTPTQSPWLSNTDTATGTPTLSPSRTSTLSLTATLTRSPSPTVTPSLSPSISGTPAVSITPSPTLTLSFSPTTVPSLGPSPAVTATPEAGGPLQVLRLVMHPNPGHGPQGQLRLLLAGPADALEWCFYTPAYIVAAKGQLHGSFKPGWNSVDLPLRGLPAGLCYLSLRAQADGRQSLPAPPLRYFYLP